MPQRTCIGCRQVRPVAELVRVVRRPEGSLAIGRTLPGRGAWLCARSGKCLDLAIRRHAFARALRAPVSDAAATTLREAFVSAERDARD